MPGKVEEKVKFVCLKLKPNEHPEKARYKVLKSLRNSEKRHSQTAAINHPLAEWCEEVHIIPELDAKEVFEVASNSKYVVFLTRDGRVCRIKCTSKAETNPVTSVDLLKRVSQPSFQELSDAEYARQLQATLDSEGERRPVGLRNITTSTGSLSMADLERRSRELMILGSVPSPEYRQDPEFFGNLARSLSHQEELVAGVDVPLIPSSPPPSYDSLSSLVPGVLGSSSSVPRSNLFSTSAFGASGGRGGGGGRGGVREGGVQQKDKTVWPDMGGIDWMMVKENPDCPSLDSKFVAMAALHSEILLVSAGSRQLYSWSCDGASPSPSLHPLTDELGLTNERISIVVSSDVRATVVTESGKVATFYDPLLRASSDGAPPPLIQSLTHAAQDYPQFRGDPVEQLSVSNFITVATTTKGKVMWWGLCPHQPPPQTTDGETRSPARPPTMSSSSSRGAGAITDGSLVRLKNGPPCGPNTVVYTKSPTHGPCVGRTMNIIEHSGLDPKTSILVKVYKNGTALAGGLPRSQGSQSELGDLSSKPPQELNDSQLYDGVEVWKLSDVIFLDDSPSVLGRVVTVDQNQAIVDVSYSQDLSPPIPPGDVLGASNSDKKKSILKVFKVSDLELCIDNRFTGSVNSPEKQEPVQISFFPSKQASSSILVPVQRTVTHHVAGIVQHRPVCILDSSRMALNRPSSAGVGNLELEGGAGNASQVIRGYKVLAIHAADDGPRMMVERYADGKAFLIGSSHASSGWLISTSFVALSTNDSKPNRCTLEEESVCAVDRGIAPDCLIDALSQSRDYDFKPLPSQSGEDATEVLAETGQGERNMQEDVPTEPFELKPQLGQKRKLDNTSDVSENLSPVCDETSNVHASISSTSDATMAEGSSSQSTKLISSVTPPFRIKTKSYNIVLPPSFISCYHSQVIFFHDVNGIICPMADRLRLKPTSTAGGGGRGQRSPPQPQLSYRSVLSRQHAISKDTNVLVFVLVPRPRTLIPSVLSGNVARVDTVLAHIKKLIDAIPKENDGTGQVPDPATCRSKLEQGRDSQPREEASCPGSIPVLDQISGTLTSQVSSESSASQDEEMPEVTDVQASGSSALSSLDGGLESPTLVASLQDVPSGAIVVRESADVSEPQTKRMRFSNPGKVVGPDVPLREAESLMADSFLVHPDSRPVSELEHKEESSASMPPALIEIDIDSEMQVIEKQDATSSLKTTTENQLSCVNSARNRAQPELESSDMVDQCRPEVLFEATVHNANLLHICCQLEVGTGGSVGIPSTLAELREATRVFRPHTVDLLRYQSITSLPEFTTKSFDELRLSHCSQQLGDTRGEEVGREEGGVSSISERGMVHRRLEILRRMLTCQQIRPLIVKLLKSKNADGHTPFMEAISQHNYYAALQILQFVEEHDEEQLAPYLGTSGQANLLHPKLGDREDPISQDEEAHPKTVFYPPLEILMESGILAPSGNGVTPVQAIFASVSPLFDSNSMCLHVSNMPVSFTAQQLLKLFQTRYPSAYKAEIFKVEEGSSSSSGSEFSDEEGDESMQENGDFPSIPRLFLNRRRRNRASELRRRARRHRFTSTLYSGGSSSALPTSGVVYFSNVTQLRAALKEMHEFRLVSNLSRVTGFGQTQSVSYLSVSLEPPADTDDDDEITARGFLDPFDPGPFEFGSTSRMMGAQRREREEKKGGGKVLHGSKFSSPQLAYQLLTKLLAHTDVAIATDNVGETAIAAVVHNTRCLVALDKLISQSDTNTSLAQFRNLAALSKLIQSRTATAGNSTSIPRLPGDVRGGMMSTSTSNVSTIAPYTSLTVTPFSELSPHHFQLVPNSKPPKRSSFCVPTCEQPSTSLSGSVGASHEMSPRPPLSFQPTSSVASQILTDISPFVTDSQSSLTEGSIPSTTVQQLKEPLRFGLLAPTRRTAPEGQHTSAAKPGDELTTSHTQSPSDFFGGSISTNDMSKTEPVELPHLSSSENQIPNQPPGNARTESASGSIASPSAILTTFGVEPTTPMEIPPITPSSVSQGGSAPSSDNTCDLLGALVTNWPCIVTTILGHYPFEKLSDYNFKGIVTPQDLERQKYRPARLSAVQQLDDFTMDLILNCKDSVISSLVGTIVGKMNAVLEENCDISVLLKHIDTQEIDLKKLDESTRTLLVGKRFLNSVVRVLALEHSRVRNAFVELHQQRQGRVTVDDDGVSVGGRRGGRGGRGNRPEHGLQRKNVVETVKTILHPFSWLAVHSLAEAAEASSAPVRHGVSKPLGANSVVPDYQTPRQSHYRSSRQNEDPHQSLARQLHVRAALLLPDPSSSGATTTAATGPGSVPTPPLPREGLVLKPHSKDLDVINSGAGGGAVAGLITGGDASIHEDSFEDLELDAQDMPSHEGDGELIQNSSGPVTFQDAPFAIHIQQQGVTGSIMVDIEPTSSDESEFENYPLDDPFTFAPNVRLSGTVTQDDGNMDEIYPFAWALDGRRIGENTTNTRPNSPSLFTIGAATEPAVPLCSIPSIRFGAGFLARTFARLVKDLVDTAQTICDIKTLQPRLRFPPAVERELIHTTVATLEQTWRWAVSVLDVAEGQLQQGQQFDTPRYVVSLRSTVGGQTTRSIVRPSRSFIGSTPAEYITYLLRTQANEYNNCLPIIDLYGYEHVVYVLDGLIYTLANWPKAATALVDQSETPGMLPTDQTSDQSTLNSETTDSSEVIAMETNQRSQGLQPLESGRFFKRTESVTFGEEDPDTHKSNEQFFGKPGAMLEKPEFVGPPNPWGQQVENFSRPLTEDYPLAQQPHLLKPLAKKEHLFSPTAGRRGSATGASMAQEGRDGEGESTAGDGRTRRKLPVSYAQQEVSLPSPPLTLTWPVEHALQRWHSAISVFAHIFLAEGPGSERSNFLNARAGFASRMARFRHQVMQLFEASQSHRDWSSTVSNTFSIRVRREQLMQDTLDTLQQMVRFHYSQIRVKFEGEDGSGPGVNRGLFASLANELKSSNTTKHPMNKVGLFFHEPGKQPEQSGLYAPCPFIPLPTGSTARNSAIKMQRRNAFRAVGRYLGLCLWFRYTIPFMVSRHVAKYLLGRELAWHDLAFYNADLYEGLRRMMLDAEEGKKSKEEFLSAYCCYFEAPLSVPCAEPLLVDLIPGGSKVPVTPARVQEYVRLYATFMMVGCVKEELQGMKEGLTDIIPSELLAGLTAEDFQLLLSGGSADITLSRLKSVIRFNHSHGSSGNICDRFEKMFWRVVGHMSNTQRQQLLYFATGSATLPVASDTPDRVPAVAITIDVIGSSNTESLPMASTCSQRMSVPLYPSYHILKKKLLQAIQCQAYGLG